MITFPSFSARDLRPELFVAGAFPLVRLYKQARAGQPRGEWEAPPPAFRNLRDDPPEAHKDEFAVPYTWDTIASVAAEFRVLQYNAAKVAFLVNRTIWTST
jgi:hypothetical protein